MSHFEETRRHFYLSRMALAIGAFVAVSVAATSANAKETSDAWITASAKFSLMTSKETHATHVHVDTTDGKVTLHGKVATATERSAAERLVLALEGVQSVKNLLQVVPPGEAAVVEKADDWIKDSAERALKDDHSLDDSHLSVKAVDKGVLLLGGTSASLTDHLRAVECVAAVPGVRHVVTEVTGPNQLTDDRVEHREKATRGGAHDDRITIAAKLRLLADPQVPALDVNVDTFRGVVTLFGIVPSDSARAAAEIDTRQVSDVASIRNELQVVTLRTEAAVNYTDGELQRTVRAALSDHPELRGITATVKAGLVRLTGTIPTQWQSLRAAHLVRAIPGVRAVDDSLRVPSGSSRHS